MKTSMNETLQIENYLHKRLPPQEALVMDAQLLLNPELKEKLQWQQQTYDLIRDSGRRHLKQELEAIHQQLFSQPEHRLFRERIFKLF